eukprot:PhF_6_TR29114/c0_g1_i1/m.42483/K12843/PRPF3, PRP3; U4/U6 small nuclear ribonucleoprotein PRP3
MKPLAPWMSLSVPRTPNPATPADNNTRPQLSSLSNQGNSQSQSNFVDFRLQRRNPSEVTAPRGLNFFNPGDVEAATKRREAIQRAKAIEQEKKNLDEAAQPRPVRHVVLEDVSHKEVIGESVRFGVVDNSDLLPPPSEGHEWWDNDAANPDFVSGVVSHIDVGVGKFTQSAEKMKYTADGGLQGKPLPKTPQEREREKKLESRARHKEFCEKVKHGDLAPNAPRLKLSNVQDVLRCQGITETLGPTELENMVLADQAARREKHEQHNEEHKLSREDRSEKRRMQNALNAEKDLQLSVYRITLAGPERGKHIWKIRENATQLHITGAIVQIGFNDFGMVIVEAGAKPSKHMRSLITRRIGDINGVEVFHGPITAHRFEDFSLRKFQNVETAKEYLKDKNCDGVLSAAMTIGTNLTVEGLL